MVSGLLATASADENVKLWDVQNGRKPALVTSKCMAVGPLFAAGFAAHSPLLLVCGGEEGKLAIWETGEASAVERRFKSRVGAAPKYQSAKLVLGTTEPLAGSSEMGVETETTDGKAAGKKKTKRKTKKKKKKKR